MCTTERGSSAASPCVVIAAFLPAPLQVGQPLGPPNTWAGKTLGEQAEPLLWDTGSCTARSAQSAEREGHCVLIIRVGGGGAFSL